MGQLLWLCRSARQVLLISMQLNAVRRTARAAASRRGGPLCKPLPSAASRYGGPPFASAIRFAPPAASLGVRNSGQISGCPWCRSRQFPTANRALYSQSDGPRFPARRPALRTSDGLRFPARRPAIRTRSSGLLRRPHPPCSRSERGSYGFRPVVRTGRDVRYVAG